MGKFDKDRHQKELSIRFCIARGMSPCLEVVIPSASELSDTTEVLTDLDVLGLEFVVDGGFRRAFFDCKSGKMSAINRAFWANGVASYSQCDEAFVLLKGKAVNNHRISALRLNVDLHDEQSFTDLGRTFDVGFDQDLSYQSSIERWNAVADAYEKWRWSSELYHLTRNIAPLSQQPWSTFRKIIAECRNIRGHVDPTKPEHISIIYDTLCGIFILWSTMGRDIRRFYEPSMSKSEFETILRYYIWGGRDTYAVRQELSPRGPDGKPIQLNLPSWNKLMRFAGIIIAAPQELAGCVNICRDLSIRSCVGSVGNFDSRLEYDMSANVRARQFIMSMIEYVVDAGGLPKECISEMRSQIEEF